MEKREDYTRAGAGREEDRAHRHDGADRDDPHALLDPLIDSPGREGLTGTTPATVYKPLPVREQITLPPDGRPAEAQPQWRRDFPIDWPQDQYVARRDFTKFLVVTSFAFVVGQAWIAVRNVFRRRVGRPPIQRVAALADVPVGGAISFNYPTEHDACLLMRPEAGVLLAYSQDCTHLSCAVVPDVKEQCLHCPCHEGCFDLHTGRPIAGPPRRPLPRIALKLEGEAIYATGVERSTV